MTFKEFEENNENPGDDPFYLIRPKIPDIPTFMDMTNYLHKTRLWPHYESRNETKEMALALILLGFDKLYTKDLASALILPWIRHFYTKDVASAFEIQRK